MVPPSLGLAKLPGVFDEQRAELSQAKIRVWMTFASAFYIVLRWVIGGSIVAGPADKYYLILPLSDGAATRLFLICSGYVIFSVALLAIIKKFPTYSNLRQTFAMASDIVALTMILLVGEAPMMIFFAMILWVAVGNAMRFGRHNLLLAPFFAQLSLIILFSVSPFWQTRFDVILTFAVCFLILSTYSVVVLRHLSMARATAFDAMQAKSRFLAQASHDLRQPIHSVGYYLDILRTTKGEDARNNLLDRIERALGSVSRLFNSLLDISRIDSGTVEVNAETIGLQQLLADIVQQNEQYALWNNVEIRYLSTKRKLHCDPALLSMMLQNLVSNAIKYSPGAKVLIGPRYQGDMVAIEIHDRGIGISDVHLPHIFKEFYRAHESGDRDTEGVGLGLAIVSRLADISGYKLEIRSQRNRGTVARISNIPISSGNATNALPAKSDMVRPLHNFHVILIEDDIDVLDATAALLRHWGCHVQAHTAPPDSVSDADVIIADYDLGNQQLGTDAIFAVRKMLGTQIPAILMTGYSEAASRKQIAEQEIRVLAKPVQPAALRSILSTLRIAARSQSH